MHRDSQRGPCPVLSGIIRAKKIGRVRLIFAESKLTENQLKLLKMLPQWSRLSQEREQVRGMSKDCVANEQTLATVHSVPYICEILRNKFWFSKIGFQ